MIRLCIGISTISPGWQSLLEQIGIQFEEIDFSYNLAEKYSCLIINSRINQHALNKIYHYTNKHSGGILCTKIARTLFKKERILSNLILDVPHHLKKLIHSFYVGAGKLFSLDFEPDSEFKKNNSRRKRFPFKNGIHPDELVSSVDKASLKNAIEYVLHQLHYHRGVPYVSKWHSPAKKPIFAFRIDTDFGNKTSIQKLFDLANHYNIPITWFLHVKAHEDWLDFFHSFKNQEIALHGYEHGTSSSYEQISSNIEQGYQLMKDADLEPDGFCVPYSIWNNSLADVLNTYAFKYSSEFTLGYDTVPFFPIHREEKHSTLQIPIHPICTGSLNRNNIDEKGMLDYFEMILQKKLDQYNNVIFYHHPLQYGLEVWKSIFDQVNTYNLTKCTFSEIATFWKQRVKTNLDILFDRDTATLTCNTANQNLILKISTNSKNFYLLKASKVNKTLHSFEALPMPKNDDLSLSTYKELTGNRGQLLKSSILDWKNRKTL